MATLVVLVVYQVPGTTAGTTAIHGVILKTGTDDVVADVTVATATSSSYGLPDLAWNGTHWLVVFEARKVSNGDRTIASRRVSEAGGLVGGIVTLGSSAGNEFHPAVTAGTNGQWAVAWDTTMAQTSTDSDVRVGRVASDGTPLDGLTGRRASFDQPQNADRDRMPDIAWGAVATWWCGRSPDAGPWGRTGCGRTAPTPAPTG